MAKLSRYRNYYSSQMSLDDLSGINATGASNNDVLINKQIDLDPLASGFSIKAIISGHGHEGPKYCCEWINKSHSYIINGLKEFSWNVWKDCGDNPIYPQGGTWPYDRAGWCPGTKVDEYVFDKYIIKRGLFVFPAGPALASINQSNKYYESIRKADLVFFDSGFFVLLLKFFKNISVSKFSGYKFLSLFFLYVSFTRSRYLCSKILRGRFVLGK